MNNNKSTYYGLQKGFENGMSYNIIDFVWFVSIDKEMKLSMAPSVNC